MRALRRLQDLLDSSLQCAHAWGAPSPRSPPASPAAPPPRAEAGKLLPLSPGICTARRLLPLLGRGACKRGGELLHPAPLCTLQPPQEGSQSRPPEARGCFAAPLLRRQPSTFHASFPKKGTRNGLHSPPLRMPEATPRMLRSDAGGPGSPRPLSVVMTPPARPSGPRRLARVSRRVCFSASHRLHRCLWAGKGSYLLHHHRCLPPFRVWAVGMWRECACARGVALPSGRVEFWEWEWAGRQGGLRGLLSTCRVLALCVSHTHTY